MNIRCLLGLHTWSSCVCTRCKKQRAHEWKGCVCTNCLKENHSWDGCTCRSCGATRDSHHQWDGCKCLTCGQMHDVQRKDYRCSICGQIVAAEPPPDIVFSDAVYQDLKEKVNAVGAMNFVDGTKLDWHSAHGQIEKILEAIYREHQEFWPFYVCPSRSSGLYSSYMLRKNDPERRGKLYKVRDLMVPLDNSFVQESSGQYIVKLGCNLYSDESRFSFYCGIPLSSMASQTRGEAAKVMLDLIKQDEAAFGVEVQDGYQTHEFGRFTTEELEKKARVLQELVDQKARHFRPTLGSPWGLS